MLKIKLNIIEIIKDTIILFIGIIALITSIYYSARFLVYTGIKKEFTYILSITYVIFLNIIFECSIGFYKKAKIIKANTNKYNVKKKNKALYFKSIIMRIKAYALCIIIFLVWLMLTSYSMLSTVAGQYNALLKNNISYSKNKNIDYVSIQIEILKENNNAHKKELEQKINILSSVDNIDKSYLYKNTTKKTEERVDKLNQLIKENNIKILGLLDKQDNKKINFNKGSVYEYFSFLLNYNIDPVYIQFFLSVFPSIFIDIISPISFAILIYRKRDY